MSDPESFDDINEAVVSEWVDETTPYERVREVISHTYTPLAADTVAERAQTSPKTARKHLDILADEGFVVTTTGENGGTHYRRSPESLVLEQAVDILQQVSTGELADRIHEMRERLTEFQDEYGVASPEELAVEQTNQTLSDPATPQQDIDPETIREWKTTRRNLAVANAALSIANAEHFVDDSSSTGSVPVQ